VRVAFGGRPVLDIPELEVTSRRWTTVIGANGAGKSTLLRAVAGLITPEGDVCIDGRAVGDFKRRELARLVAFVPQSPLIPAGATVADYVLLGRTPHHSLLGGPGRTDLAAADEAMGRLELGPLADRVVTTLSGGERQRVVLARALAQAAPILLLDEPTASLDIGHQQQVLELVDSLRRDRDLTVLSTMHDLTLAGQYANRLVLLDAGRIVASGAPDDVLTEQHLADYYGASVRVIHDGGRAFVLPYRQSAEVSP
jgi:iron complex transport system ATP-binding protein